MPSRSNVVKLLKYPTLFYKVELYSKLKSSIFLDFCCSTNPLVIFKINSIRLSSLTNKTKIRRGCVITGRTRSINGFFSFSRFAFKSRVVKGMVPGLKKAS